MFGVKLNGKKKEDEERRADVKHRTVAIRDGAVTEYRVDLKVAFGLDSIDDD